MAPFNPYHKWLGIPLDEQPASYYRLLGIGKFESDPDVIDGAAEQRTIYLRTFQTGPNSELAERLLNEVSEARVNLLDGKTKAQYDTRLRTLEQPSLPLGTTSSDAATAEPVNVPSTLPQKTHFPSVGQGVRRTTGRGRPKDVRQGRQRQVAVKPFWQQPWIMTTGGVGAMVLLLIFFSANKPAKEVSPPAKKNNTTSGSKGTSKKPSRVTQESVTSLAREFAHSLARNAGKSGSDIVEVCEIADLLVSPYRQHLAAKDLTEQEKFCQFVAEQAIEILTAGHTLTAHELSFRRLPMNITKRPPVGAGQEEFNRYTETVLEAGRQDYRDKYTQEFDKEARERLEIQEK